MAEPDRPERATDPHTPIEVLQDLAVTHPREVLSNPVMGLLRLADPAFLTTWPVPAALAIARMLDAGPAVLRQMARHHDKRVRQAVAENPRTDGATLVFLSRLYFMYEPVAEHPNTPPEHLAHLAEHPWESVRQAVRRNPSWRGSRPMR